MTYLVFLVPIALGMGAVGLVAFLWSMRSGQYEDLDGAAERVLLVDADRAPLYDAGVHRTETIRQGNSIQKDITSK
jgi:cbb3-type cytochrome oxidase maturation protein